MAADEWFGDRTGWRCEGCGHWNEMFWDVCELCSREPPELEEWEDDDEEEWYEEFHELGGEG